MATAKEHIVASGSYSPLRTLPHHLSHKTGRRHRHSRCVPRRLGHRTVLYLAKVHALGGPYRKSLADDLYEDALATAAVEFAVEDLFPGAEVETAVGDGDDDLATHHLSLNVSVGVVFAGAVVVILADGWVWVGQVVGATFRSRGEVHSRRR